MGCGPSRNNLATVDDSVNVMMQKDKKSAEKKGQEIKGYVPRAEHPLLAKKEKEEEEEKAKIVATEE